MINLNFTRDNDLVKHLVTLKSAYTLKINYLNVLQGLSLLKFLTKFQQARHTSFYYSTLLYSPNCIN